ncbi:MAG: hypothetical protein FWD63_01760 [Propionibacteriaceae bacterium]|nr:hypothetical protein [Propionibacteriaceae bacterium]
MDLMADLIELGDGHWRLLSPTGMCCDIDQPSSGVLTALQYQPAPLPSSFETALAANSWLPTRPLLGDVWVLGSGTLAGAIALALAAADLRVLVSAPDCPPTSLDPLGQHASAAAAIRSMVVTRCPSAKVELAQHWTAITPESTGLVIVASHTVQPDRAITDHLARQGVPYLVVRAHHETAVVGPLVTHTGDACLACLDLTQADHDEWWPTSVRVLATRPAKPTLLATNWAAAQAACEAVWFLRGHGVTLSGATIELDGTKAGLARRRWKPHRDCSCQHQQPWLVADVTLAA